MSTEFRGFSGSESIPENLFAQILFIEQTRHFIVSIMKRLGPQVGHSRWHAGRDERAGRDYFFENMEFRIRGRSDPAFIGFYHYRRPEEQAGSFWQVWEWEHADTPAVSVPMAELVKEIRQASKEGQLPTALQRHADTIRSLLGLH